MDAQGFARFHMSVYALLVAAVIPILFTLLVNVTPSHNVNILWFEVLAGVNALTLLVSFGVSGGRRGRTPRQRCPQRQPRGRRRRKQ